MATSTTKAGQPSRLSGPMGPKRGGLATDEGRPGADQGASGGPARSIEDRVVGVAAGRQQALGADRLDLVVQLGAVEIGGAVVVRHRDALLSWWVVRPQPRPVWVEVVIRGRSG